MKRLIVVLFILSFPIPSLAATVGGPEIGLPEKSLYLKERAIQETLDRYEYKMDIKASLETEVITNMDLDVSPGAGVEGESLMVKFASNYEDLFEVYLKIGTAKFEANWHDKTHTHHVEVNTDSGTAWGLGVKAKLAESKNYGIKLTLDAQYRGFDLELDEVEVAKESIASSVRTNNKFEIEEWQVSLLASKRFILPTGIKDFYIVPYTGVTFLSSDVDAGFKFSGLDYSTDTADNDNKLGVILGCDVMPSLLSWYLLNFEVRLIDETAFTLGGKMKF